MNIVVDKLKAQKMITYEIMVEIDEETTLMKVQYNTNFSCGVKTIVGVQYEFGKDQEGFREKFSELLNRNWNLDPVACMLQVSINDSMPELTDILDDLCTYKTEWHRNPNGGNNIRIYTFVV